ncbi:MAG TPA: Ku protein [Methylomirabilota bacterium]|jgi:DNA end-binding protein Ku
MRPLWKGALTFGLVNIPVGLYSATTRSDLSFRLLHAKDQAPIAYRRVCTEENVEVPWPEIVRGYEYEKGQFVVMTDADFEQADVEATQTIDIRDFVRKDAIPAAYFEQPYYLEPQQTGTKAYALLREALRRSERVGVATVVLRQREHLAAVQPEGEALTLTTMRFAHEIVPPRGLTLPGDAGLDRREIDLALQLVDTLAGEFEAEKYRDQYREALLGVIDQKLQGRAPATPATRKPPTKVVDLMQALEASLKARPARGRREPPASRKASPRRRAS